jgi:hypothetical protein
MNMRLLLEYMLGKQVQPQCHVLANADLGAFEA